MLFRKQEKMIRNWLQNDKEALLLTGARQTGKTTLIREVLKKEQADYVEFNFIEQSEVVDTLKTVEKQGVEDLIARLSFLAGRSLHKQKTVIFFDEVQEYKEIVTMIKFLVQEGSFRYILSGSLLGVELRDLRSAPVGYMRIITIFPLDFEEFFLAAGGNKSIVQELKEHYVNRTPVDSVLHKKMMDLFYIYLVVGGMPEAVQSYVEENDFNRVIQVHNTIIPLYKQDFSKYEKEDKKLKLHKIYDLIPSEISSKNKRYIYSDLDKSYRPERYEKSFEWLINAGVALPVYNVTEPKLPLTLNKKSNLLKLFLSDVGLLSTMYGRATILETLNHNSFLNYGAIFENVVAQELIAHGYGGYYFQSKKQGELDFVIEYENKCLPIEVKSGKDYKRHSSLNNSLTNAAYEIPMAYVLSNGNIEMNGKIIYLPIYMMMFINERYKRIPTFPRVVF